MTQKQTKESTQEQTKEITKEIELTNKQNKFVEYYCQGYSGYESAKLAGYEGDYNNLCAIASENLKKLNIVQAIKNNRKDLRYRFREEAANAMRVMLEIMNNPKISGRTRLDAAKDLLDRAGYKPSDKIELSGVDGNPIEYETRQTKEIVSRARKLLLEVSEEVNCPPVIDMPVENAKKYGDISTTNGHEDNTNNET